jgi:hypothetical protein
MNNLRGIFGMLLLLTCFTSCNKRVCPDFLQNPDCNVESRSRFYGVYKGTSLMDSNAPATTQWAVGPGGDLGEILIAAHMNLKLDPRDPRVFNFTNDSYMDGNKYIRHNGYDGRFTDDSLYFDFWLAEGESEKPGEKRIHYVFTGKKK